MTEMEKIAEAVLQKVRSEAEGILAEAKTRADEVLARARQQRDARLEQERSRMLEEAKVEAARVLAQSTIAARQELLKAKAAIVDEVFAVAKKGLAAAPGAPEGLLRLIEEGLETLGLNKARVIVSPRDVAAVRAIVKADRKLGERVAEVSEAACSGGAVVEDLAGIVRVDNTYETRLAMVRPAMLVNIGNELLKS
jgi:V/A-type H+-transporting ATPase subunit E